jgi:fluoride ion exporter CrcB/FEX
MWVGVALPQMALHLGGFIAELGYPQNEMSPKLIPCVDVVKVKSAISFQLSGDSGVFALFVVSTILSIALPTAVYPTWIHLMYTSVFGVCGAYLRYLLSHFNKRIKDFPIGTFACNIGGTWLLAIFTCISKFGVDYYDIPTQAVLYGLSYGFCGCLTTVSTLVNEIDKLPKKQSYLYTIATCIVAQFGILLFYDVYAWTTIPESSLMPPPVNFCVGQQFLCEGLMDNLVGCPTTDRDIVICRDDNDYTTVRTETNKSFLK